MSELAEAIVDAPPIEEEPKRKRISGYDRMKRKNQWLAGDVAALEGLVGSLLKQLEKAIDRDVTSHDRERIQRMIQNVRARLAETEEPPPRQTINHQSNSRPAIALVPRPRSDVNRAAGVSHKAKEETNTL